MIDPLFDPNDVLPNDPYLQIPLDAQPIDLAGLSAQGKQKQWIFPDNIIPVAASMHGQKYSNPQQAQVSTFTDDKRLRVDATIAGGGGGTGTAPTSKGLNISDDIVAANTNNPYATCPADNIIYGCELRVYPMLGASGTITGQVRFMIVDDAFGAGITLAQIAAIHIRATINDVSGALGWSTGWMTFTAPVDLTQYSQTGNGLNYMLHNETDNSISFGIYIMGSHPFP